MYVYQTAGRSAKCSSLWVAATVMVVLCGLMPSRCVVDASLMSYISKLEGLLKTEKALSEDLRLYVAKQQDRTQRLSSLLDDMDRDVANASVDPERHLGNALNVYRLIKRLGEDWQNVIENDIKNTKEFLTSLKAAKLMFPSNDDLAQVTENLNILNPFSTVSKFLIVNGTITEVDKNKPKVKPVKVAAADDDDDDYEDYDEEVEEEEEEEEVKPSCGCQQQQQTNYERLCRGEEIQVNAARRLLTCRYSRPNPMFYIRPIKEELISENPPVRWFHDVISKYEIDMLKVLAKSRFEQSMTFTQKTDSKDTSASDRVRASEQAWLFDVHDSVVARLSQKLGAIINLDHQSAEPFQVLRYGLGGHYVPHYDFIPAERGVFKETGNRIATVICYLSNVTDGGYTVMPQIGVHLKPEMGSCAVWFNCLRSGQQDGRVLHGGCPIVTGVKWAFTKWFHEVGQEFRRPCSTSPDE